MNVSAIETILWMLLIGFAFTFGTCLENYFTSHGEKFYEDMFEGSFEGWMFGVIFGAMVVFIYASLFVILLIVVKAKHLPDVLKDYYKRIKLSWRKNDDG